MRKEQDERHDSMQAIKQTMKAPESRELQIRLPAEIAPNDIIEVIVIYGGTSETYEGKIDMIKAAMDDAHFRRDLEETAADYRELDSESWET